MEGFEPKGSGLGSRVEGFGCRLRGSGVWNLGFIGA